MNINTTAIIVTRGDQDLTDIVETIPTEMEVIIWDNSGTVYDWDDPSPVSGTTISDLSVYGRYAAIQYATGDAIYVQDDDCIIPVEEVLAAYEPGRIVANMVRSRWDDYPDSTMVGWGAIFDRDLPNQAFHTFARDSEDRYAKAFVNNINEDSVSAMISRTCDVIFSSLTPRTVIDVGFQHLPWAETDGRMFKQPGHKRERDLILELCRSVRTWPDDDRRNND